MPRTKPNTIAETDLYQPIHDHLVAQGFTVRSEVRHCDITAAKGDDLVIVELKRRFSTSFLIQAAQRLKVTPSVYVALPKLEPSKRSHGIEYLLRRLELGLIYVSFGSGGPTCEIVFHPLPFERRRKPHARQAVLREMATRSGDYNRGGSVGRKLATGYREKAIHIACCLERLGPLSPRQLRAFGTAPNTSSILYNDFYGWFERLGRGVYALREQGKAELAHYPRLARRYREIVRALALPLG